jgi:hypothetical protein
LAPVVESEIDDAGMIRVYARENATQRGNSSTAIAGTVASAVRFLSKAILTGSRDFTRTPELVGNLASEKGLGEPVITNFLDGVPGINRNTVKEQLANLKSSGNYGRIIGEVKDEIEQEHREALKELERAERERRKPRRRSANPRPPGHRLARHMIQELIARTIDTPVRIAITRVAMLPSATSLPRHMARRRILARNWSCSGPMKPMLNPRPNEMLGRVAAGQCGHPAAARQRECVC